MAKQYDKDQLIIDWRTGGFTQRDLAYKHKVSRSLVNQIVKDIDKDLKDVIDKKTESDQLLKDKTRQEVDAIEQNVNFRLGLIKQVELFSNNAIRKADDLLKVSSDGSDFRAIVDGVDKLTITNKINERHAKPSTTNIQNNQQNNFSSLSDDDLMKELKALRYGNAITTD